MKRSRLTVLLLSAALMVAAVPSLAMADENGTDVSDGETAEVTESAEVKNAA